MIHLNSFGPEVETWQNFLVGQGLFHGHVGGLFDKATQNATISFQRLQNVLTDGKVGDETYGVAKRLGFITEANDDDSRTGPNWPPRPESLSPLTDDNARQAIFGKFQYEPAGIKNDPEAIVITDTWERDNIISIAIPQLGGIRGSGSAKIQFHKKAVDQLLALFKAWEDADLIPLILSWGGSYAPRFIRGSRVRLSNHAYASAFDINVAWNYMGTRPALVGCQGSVRELVPIANELGFFWGGHYGFNKTGQQTGGRPDGMHFEIAKIIDVSDPYLFR